jgi:hypothetical protein
VESVRVLPESDHAVVVTREEDETHERRPLPSLSKSEPAAPCDPGNVNEYPVIVDGGVRRIAFVPSEG